MQIKDHALLTRLIRTRPLLLASILLLTGCIIGYVAEPPLFAGAMLLGLMLIAALILRQHRRICAALLAAAMLPLGMLRFGLAWHATKPLPDQKDAQLSGRICEIPVWRADTERTICILDELRIDGEPSGLKLRLYLRGDIDLLQGVELGQQISCNAHIWVADTATNPGQYNFSNHLRTQGLSGYATAEIETAHFTPPELRAADMPKLLRAALGRHVDRLFPENSGIARAFLLGDRSQLSDDDRRSYSDSGAAHLLAISGMHITVLAGAISLLISRFAGKRASFLITMLILLLYGCLIGFSSSLSRAIIMFAVFSGAAVIGRYSDSISRLGAALFLCLLLRPTAILEAGFVLSFSASAGISLLYEPITQLLHADRLIHSRMGVGFRGMLHRLRLWIVTMLISTISAQLAVLPAVVYFFGAQPLFSLLVNLFAVPLAMCAYILSIFGALSCLPPVAAIGDFLFGLLTDSVSIFGRLPLSTLRIARFPLWLVLLCAAAILLSSGLSKIPLRIRRFMPLAVVAAVFISNGVSALTTRGCSFVFLDAGHADCAVLRTEGRVYLFDTGDSYSPAADYISAMNYPVDAVFLSHMHIDHAGGLMELLEVQIPERIYISANWDAYEADDGVSELLDAARSLGSEIVSLSAGDRIQLSEETFLDVFSPTAGICASSANDDSLVLCVEHRGTKALFTGDASADEITGRLCDIDLLKAGHHGAADSLSPALLMETTPSAVVIPTGYNNYGHPAEKTLDLLGRGDIRIFRTDHCGAISCRIGENGRMTLDTFRNPLLSEAANGLE